MILKIQQFKLEPVGRSTAPAITAATFQSIKISDDPMLLVLSADHVIQDVETFHQAVNIASNQAQQGRLVTFGVVPTNANTGYGYIKSSNENKGGAYNIEEFVEKPDFKTAEKYLDQGNYLWNSGMFMFKADTLINELNIYSPDTVKLVKDPVNNATKDLDFIRLDKQALDPPQVTLLITF